MSKFWDEIDEKTKSMAEKFVEDIKTGKLVKRTLPNMFKEFPLYESYQSFKDSVESQEEKDIVDSYYRGSNGK